MNKDYIDRVRQDCLESKKLVQEKYKKISHMRSIADFVAISLGVAGTAITIISLLPEAKKSLPDEVSTLVTLIASIVIIAQFSLDRIVFKDPPSRYRDYAFYLGIYPQKIDNELAKKVPDWKKIEAWIDLAETNLNDAASVWPDLVVRR